MGLTTIMMIQLLFFFSFPLWCLSFYKKKTQEGRANKKHYGKTDLAIQNMLWQIYGLNCPLEDLHSVCWPEVLSLPMKRGMPKDNLCHYLYKYAASLWDMYNPKADD